MTICIGTGIFGGTFNPVHLGHVRCIAFILDHSFVDEVFILPSNPPHKNHAILPAPEHRLNMLRLAFEEMPRVKISLLEINSPNKSYTYETLQKLKSVYPERKFYFILGEDNLLTIHTWYNYKNLILENNFLMMHRADYNVDSNACPDLEPDLFSHLTKNRIQTPDIPVSSTDIREEMQKSFPKITGYIPAKVVQYIYRNKLYRH